jgi:lipopolysaccharide/colanic/teichoic acid biosynthesis glycosyltransferase
MDYPRAKRIYDVVFAAAGLAALSPLLLLIAIAVKCGDRGPVFYRQQRVGLFGKRFWIWKFRTMVVNADKIGLSVTKDGDARITPIGRLLRKTKLDELPQLWNVVRGDMSLVGPRPEVPRYVERYTEEQRQILGLKPGITDLASLEFSNEEEILSAASNVEEYYVGYCVPRKIELNRIYAERASIWQDTVLILKTLFFWCRDKQKLPVQSTSGDVLLSQDRATNF